MSTMTIRHIDPDELLRMPDGDRYELLDGQPVEKSMGAKADKIAGRLTGWLDQYCVEHNLGHAFGSATAYRCFSWQQDRIRIPDSSVVLAGRFPNEEVPDGYILIPPDLAIEVLSPNDLAEEVEAKVNEYLTAGVRLVWVVSPMSRTVQVRRPDSTSATVSESKTLSGEDVLPGFSRKLADLFR